MADYPCGDTAPHGPHTRDEPGPHGGAWCPGVPATAGVTAHQAEPGEWWRTGRKIPRNLYRVTPANPDGEDIGRMDSAELAALVVEAVNRMIGDQR